MQHSEKLSWSTRGLVQSRPQASVYIPVILLVTTMSLFVVACAVLVPIISRNVTRIPNYVAVEPDRIVFKHHAQFEKNVVMEGNLEVQKGVVAHKITTNDLRIGETNLQDVITLMNMICTKDPQYCS